MPNEILENIWKLILIAVLFVGLICQDPTPLHGPVGLGCKTLAFEDKMTFVLCGLSLF